MLYLLAISALTIYGYVIYFSDDNDCQDHADTTIFLVFMIIFMFIGTFCILLFIAALILIPCLYYHFRDQQRRQPGKFEDEGQIS